MDNCKRNMEDLLQELGGQLQQVYFFFNFILFLNLT